MEALIDLRNLLAQGYVPVIGQDGQTVYLVQAARSVRGGVTISFLSRLGSQANCFSTRVGTTSFKSKWIPTLIAPTGRLARSTLFIKSMLPIVTPWLTVGMGFR